MIEVYSVDRRALYKVGEDLKFYKNLDSNPIQAKVPFQTDQEVRDRLLKEYKDGLSPHGIQFLLGGLSFQNGMVPISPVIELIWESIRKENYPKLPSRFQSYFGSKNKEEAIAFREQSQSQQCNIYLLRSEFYFEADMNLLTFAGSAISTLDLAHKYWSGEKSPNPCVEVLLSKKVNVIKKVNV